MIVSQARTEPKEDTMARTVTAAEIAQVAASHNHGCINQAEMNAWDNGCDTQEDASMEAVANLIDGMASCYCEDYAA